MPPHKPHATSQASRFSTRTDSAQTHRTHSTANMLWSVLVLVATGTACRFGCCYESNIGRGSRYLPTANLLCYLSCMDSMSRSRVTILQHFAQH